MLDGLFIVSLICTCKQLIEEACQPTIPAEYWGNKELYHKDLMSGVPIEQRMKNLENGKYKLVESYPEPHRDANGKIIIENCTLYKEDVRKYGAYQAQQWAKQGKYNLTQEELEKVRKKYEADMERLYKLL